MVYTLEKALRLKGTEYAFDCTISNVVFPADFKMIKKNFSFDWKTIAKQPNIYVVKLTVENNIAIEALMAFEYKEGYVEVLYVERRKYKVESVFENLLSIMMHFACKKSFEIPENEGYVGFLAKTALMDYYSAKLGAKKVFGQRMQISTVNSKKLLHSYDEK